jgi:predicted nucleotidyltransferase
MLDAIKSRQRHIADLCRTYHVSRLALVGSAARGHDHQSHFDFRAALEGLIGLPVDLIEERAIRNPFIRARFDVDRELVYEA